MSDEEVLVAGEIRQEERPGWSRSCPSCGVEIRYTVLNLIGGAEPFLYCDQGSDFILREEDKEAIRKLAPAGEHASVHELRMFYEELEARLPPCPAGGQFSIWANISCPHCSYEFPYAGGQRNEKMRFYDSQIIWIEGAIAFRGARLPSSRLARVRVDRAQPNE